MEISDSANVSSVEWTDEKVESFLSHLSEASFKNRTPVVIYHVLIIVVGVVGNTLVLLVYGFRFRPSSTRVFVLSMACLDLLTNLGALPLQIDTVRHAYNDNHWRCRIFFAFSTLCTQPSGLLLVVVALDRLSRICAPLRKQLNHRQAVKIAVGTVSCAVAIFAPFVPYYGIHRVNTTVPGIQARMCWSEDEFKHTFYSKAYKILVAIVFFLGLAIMGVSYISIGIKLWKKKLNRKRSLRLQQEQEKQNAAQKMVTDTGDKDQDNTLQSGLDVKGQVLVHPEVSDTYFFDTTSTDDFLSDPERPEQGDTQLGTHDSDPQIDAPEDRQGRGAAGTLSSGVDPKRMRPEEKRNKARGQRRLVARSTSVHQCMRRMRSRTTLMMAVLTLFYIINWLPHLVMRYIRDDPVNWCDNFTDCDNTYGILIRSIYLNSAVNAFVYSFCSERFRMECRELFRGAFRKLCGTKCQGTADRKSVR